MFNHDHKTVPSYYEHTRNLRIDAPQLQQDIKADVVIIGGGLTGCSTALHLATRGVDVAVVEARYFGWGASGRSGGQIVNGFSVGQEVLEKLVGMESAKALWDHSVQSVEYTRQLIKTHHIDCDLSMGYLHVGVKRRQAKELEQWAEHLSRAYHYSAAAYHDKGELAQFLGSDLYQGGVSDSGSGHLHPLNYCLGIAKAAQDAGARLFQNSAAVKVESSATGKVVHCAAGERRNRADEKRVNGARVNGTRVNGTLSCDQVVYGCNAYLTSFNRSGLAPKISNKIMPVGTYIIATEPLREQVALGLIANRAAVADTNFVLDYYRLSADNRMLFGGRVSYSTLEPVKLTQSLRRRMVRVFPQLQGVKIDFSWGGYVAITRNRAPHIGQMDDRSWFAQGYSGHGMALSGYMGKLLAQAILGDREGIACFEKVPHKTFPGGALLRMPTLVAAMGYYKLKDYF
ncbi:NAD(P)/FAD-dependent oxidoreductase [Candidatus Spongiihabitans sp.]|uniref:NAD(P)/FAD-dependent oxidoreductase n=1 Tax=Candidatus Spongiihabitans sp. TaxID=3101308 RepID=UPI003C7D6DFF